MKVSEGFIPFRGWRTWYRILGDLDNQIPLVLLHGGPGVPHQSLEPLESFAATGRPLVFYDQLGCGESDRPEDPEIYSLALFLDELEAVRQALGLDQLHLLGHSWGGMLAMEYALQQPPGLRSLVLVGAPACQQTFSARQKELRQHLPEAVRSTMERHEASGTVSAPEYWTARRVWDQQYVYRLQPWPDFLVRTYAAMNLDINMRMWTSELIGWDIRPRLNGVRVPTLVVAGRFDGQVPGEERFLHEGIVDSQLVVFEASSHHPFAEEPERFQKLLEEFLSSVESGAAPMTSKTPGGDRKR